MADKAKIGEGWGYFDVTHYPYGGCFKRVVEETEVTIIGPAGKHPEIETKVQFPDGTFGVAPNRAIEVEK